MVRSVLTEYSTIQIMVIITAVSNSEVGPKKIFPENNVRKKKYKSRIRETLGLSTDADRNTNMRKKPKKCFFVNCVIARHY